MPRLGTEWPVFEHLCEQHRLICNDIPNAWIAGAVLTHHDHLVSFDTGFRRFLKTNEFTLLKP
ncbi:MAG: hypothetical protein M3461_00525 [Pseudomonadota bacterium]|nr:hypothetical protein [Pseudomonadota bacterium]